MTRNCTNCTTFLEKNDEKFVFFLGKNLSLQVVRQRKKE